MTSIALDHTKSLASTTASKACSKLSSFLNLFGFTGVIHSSAIKYIFGISLAHPGYFLGSILAGIILQLGAEKITESHLLSEIEQITKNLQIVTSNLHAHYTHASLVLAESFTQDHHYGQTVVSAAIKALIDGR